ncbi:Protein-export membrane protein SecF [Desulfovibrionales bacterium]
MGLYFIKPNTTFDFVGRRYQALIFSGCIILAGIIALIMRGGPQFGIDFAGGIIAQLKLDKPVEVAALNKVLTDLKLPSLAIQRIGSEMDNSFLLRIGEIQATAESLRQDIDNILAKSLPDVKHELQRFEMVGPKVGGDLRGKALQALLYSVLCMAVYISGRFENRWWTASTIAVVLGTAMYFLDRLGVPVPWMTLFAMVISHVLWFKLRLTYSLGAMISLVHDVVITVGIFAILGKEIDLTVVAALLTIVGYSMNDTIIVFDRIRENVKKKADKSFDLLINRSINETLSRTILTSSTVLLVVLCLYLFGGSAIHNFAFALLVGVIVGTYSSIFVASPVLLAFVPHQEELIA